MSDGGNGGPEDPTLAETVGLVQGAKEADPDAWTALSDKIRAFLLREFGGERLAGSNEFDDLFTMVLAEFFEGIQDFEVRTRGEFWSFVRTMARHRILDLKRAAGAKQRDERRILPTGQAGEDGDADPLDRLGLDRSGTASQFARARELGEMELECLSRIQREEARTIYRLRRLEDLSHDEIARRVGRSKTRTVRWLYKETRDRVLACLRRRLDTGYGSWLDELSG